MSTAAAEPSPKSELVSAMAISGLLESHMYPADTTSQQNISAGAPGFASAQCAAVAIAFSLP